MLTIDWWNYSFIFHGIAFGKLPTLVLFSFFGYLNGSLFEFGVMSAFASLFSILSSIYAGRLPEKFGRVKPFILISFLLSGLILFALSQVKEILLFQALYILLEISNSIYIPSTRILIAETYNRTDWSRMFARHNLIVGVSGTIGLALCSLLVSSIDYRTLLLACGPLVLTSFLVAFVVIKDPSMYIERWLSRVSRPIDDMETLSYWLGSKGFHLKPTVNMALFGAGTLIFAIATSSAFPSLPFFFNNVIFMSSSVIFAIFMFRSFIGAFSYVVVERWLSKWRDGNAIKIASFARAGLVLLIASLALIASFAPVVAIVVLSAVAFSWSLYSVDRSTIIMDHSPEGSIGVHGALRRIGIVFGNLLSGLIPTMFGFNLLFVLTSALFLISFFIFCKGIS
ncbi:MAG: MFS transporter [Candidatus Bathyarchaeota archaeon]|nr:MAG: MFS transporter [Candidatus Bathyarchaeota archaeon]